MMMSFTDAIDFINPAYNPNVASFFPQPLLISHPPITDFSVTSCNERSLAVSPESFNALNTNQPRAVELLRKKSSEALRCEICNISCNSKKMLEKHISGKKHGKKTGKQNPDTLMLDCMKTEYMEGAETRSVKNIYSDALPGLEKMYAASGISCGTQAMPEAEPSSNCSHEVLEIHIPKQQGFSTSVADDTCNSKVDDEIMADKRQSTQLKADYSADLMLYASNAYPVEVKRTNHLSHLDWASRTPVRFCTVCNIFSNSQVALEKHLAGKTHARKVKYLGTVMSLPESVYPIEVPKSNTSKFASDTISQADSSSFVPVGCTEIKETIHSEGGTLTSSPKVCTICNIKCNSQELLQSHLSGRKHASKVRRLGSSAHTPYHSTKDNILDKSVFSMKSYATPETIPVIPMKDDNSAGQLYVCSNSNGSIQFYESESTQRASKRGKIVQFAYCDVCKINCNSSEILDAHIMGKKHMKQLGKLGM